MQTQALRIHWRLTRESHPYIMTQNQTISKSCFVDTRNMIYCCLVSGHGYNTLHYITDLLDLINLV